MDFYVTMAISVMLQLLTDKKQLTKWAPAFAKVYVRIKRVAENDPTLAAAIARAEEKG